MAEKMRVAEDALLEITRFLTNDECGRLVFTSRDFCSATLERMKGVDYKITSGYYGCTRFHMYFEVLYDPRVRNANSQPGEFTFQLTQKDNATYVQEIHIRKGGVRVRRILVPCPRFFTCKLAKWSRRIDGLINIFLEMLGHTPRTLMMQPRTGVWVGEYTIPEEGWLRLRELI